MDTLKLIVKLLSGLGILISIIELLPKELQENLEGFIKRKLSVKSYLISVYSFIVSIVVLRVYLHFAGEVMFYILGILFILIGSIIGFLFLEDSFLGMLRADYLGKIGLIVLLYIVAFVSWIVPFDSLFFLFYPFEKITAGISGIPVFSFVLPYFKTSDFYDSFMHMTTNLENSIFQEPQGAWYQYINPLWIFFQCTSLFSFLTILIAEILFFISLSRIIVFSISSLYFPIFQIANFIKRKSNLEKNRIPIMGILITIFSNIVSLFL